jgi:hypothetical protein
MTYSLVVLKNGLTLVSETEQLDYEPAAHLIDPMTFSGTTKVTLKAWPQGTGDRHILLRSEDLLTVCEVEESLLNAYLKKTGKVLKEEGVSATIDEVPEVHDFDLVSDEEYEPRYVEDPT